jgi:hypothetical protein
VTFDLATGAREGVRPLTLSGNVALGPDSVVIASDGQVVAFALEGGESRGF